MQDPHTTCRIEFAKYLANQLATFDGVKAIIIAGSVSRGYADEYSDVEIPVFWGTLPDDSTRHAIVAAINGEFLHGYDGPAREDQLLIGGVQVDLWHISVAHEEEILDAVLHKHQFDLGTLNALDTIRSCIPIFGDEIVQIWKLRAQEYPIELAKRVIDKHLSSFSMGELFISAQRKNPTAFYAQLTHLQQEVFLILLALNQMYFPTFKWLYPTLESMQFKPENISYRFRQAFEVSHEEALTDTKLILEEILHRVERSFPQIETAPIHRRLSYLRTAHKADKSFGFAKEA